MVNLETSLTQNKVLFFLKFWYSFDLNPDCKILVLLRSEKGIFGSIVKGIYVSLSNY